RYSIAPIALIRAAYSGFGNTIKTVPIKRTVEKTVLTGFVIVLALFGIVGVVSQRTIVGLVEDNQWVTHTHMVLELLQRVSFDVTQAEASVRGFVITGNDNFETQYDAA